MIPSARVFHPRADIRATLTAHLIRGENRKTGKDPKKPSPSRALAGCQGMWGGPGCGVGGMQAFLSLFPNIPFCSRLNIFTCRRWNTQVHVQTQARGAGMASQCSSFQILLQFPFLLPAFFRVSSPFGYIFISVFPLLLSRD